MEQPFSGREAGRPGSGRVAALYNSLCFTIGAGMLGLSHALLFARELHTIPIVLGGALCFYTARLLHRVQLECGAPNYHAIGASMGRGGRACSVLVRATLTFNQLGIAILYMITVSRNMEILLHGNKEEPRWEIYVVLGAVTFLATSLCGSLADVCAVSFVGLLSVLSVGVLVVAEAWEAQPTSPQCRAVSPTQTIAGLGTAIFAFGGHPVYPEVQGSMLLPGEFGKVLGVAFGLMTALFALVAFSSWRSYGCSVHGYILDDLKRSVWRQVAVGGMTLHLVAALPVVLLPAMICLEGCVHAQDRLAFRLLFRLVIVALVVLVAFFLPFFEDVLSLLGGLTENALVFFFPIVFHYLSFGRRAGALGTLADVIHALTLLLAGAIFLIGTSTSVENIVDKWHRYHPRW